jgi:hypothetical protein
MTDEDRIELFALRSAHVAQSVAALRPDFPRWVRQLRAQGIDQIPTSPWDPNADPRAVNLLCTFLAQKSSVQTSTQKHELRNISRIRPHKL